MIFDTSNISTEKTIKNKSRKTKKYIRNSKNNRIKKKLKQIFKMFASETFRISLRQYQDKFPALKLLN